MDLGTFGGSRAGANPFAVAVQPVPVAFAPIVAPIMPALPAWPTIGRATELFHAAGRVAVNGFRRFASGVDAYVRDVADPCKLHSFVGFPFVAPHEDGKAGNSDTEGMRKLAMRTLETITSISVLRSHGLAIDYPDAALLRIFDELKSMYESSRGGMAAEASVASLRYFMQAPATGAGTIPTDAVTAYCSASVPTPAQFMHTFRVAMVNSPLVERSGFATDAFGSDPTFMMLARHALRVANNGADELMRELLKLIPQPMETDDAAALPRMQPPTRQPKVAEPSDKEIVALLQDAYDKKPRVWDYDPSSRSKSEGEATPVKPLEKYYGYRDIRDELAAHFTAFAGGETTKPLALSGPAGVGKTHLPVAYAMKFPNLHLLRVPAAEISNIKSVVDSLRDSPHRFVVLVDDVGIADAAELEAQWASFRDTFEGAGQKAPPNIMLVMSTNGAFPANVRTRCRHIEFPDISKPGQQAMLTITGMIEDYLRERKLEKNADFDLAVRIVANDFTHGAVDTEIARLMGKPMHHSYEQSPRGLDQYLGDLQRTQRWQREIMPKIAQFKTRSAEDRTRVEAELADRRAARERADEARARQTREMEALVGGLTGGATDADLDDIRVIPLTPKGGRKGGKPGDVGDDI